ncbi:MAG: beta-mannosidase [Candidatus Hadarchaeota archaeon]
MRKISLAGDWQFRQVEADEWLNAKVPGGVYSDLWREEKIKDPYYGDNELDLQWIGKSDWEYRRHFEVDEEILEHEKVILKCNGLDTVSEVFINGKKLGETENMHRSYEFDIGDVLEEGSNEILIKFKSPVKYGIEKQDDYPYPVPAIRYPVDQPARNFIRKAQCHYGWDWGPCFPTMGIWREISIIAFSGPRIRFVTTEQDHGEEEVDLKARVGVEVLNQGRHDFELKIAGREFKATKELQEGNEEVDLKARVQDPDLWWPRGFGDQPLYDMEVSVADNQDSYSLRERIGFRDLKLVREEDDVGESFYFEVNGVPIFAKGANWVPIDALYDRVSTERYDYLLSDMVEANMNMIRVWGGGYYEKDDFYRLCDEKGILVWQDFMFACGLYPADEDFLDNVEEEVRYQVRSLANHPSIALWCGNNENEMALKEWFNESDDLEEFRKDYERLYLDTVGRTVAEEDPSRSYWPSSPSSGGDEDPHSPEIGDEHYWDVWHEGKPFSNYLEAKPRFASEFGYQSFASPDTLLTTMEENDLNPTSPIMEHHQRNEGGNKRILKRMADHFRIPFSFDDFVYLSQVQQGLAMKTAIEHWRRIKPRCMGTLYWQLNDLWPCASWSSIEYRGKWKALHYMAKRFYSPVLVSTVENDEELDVWITSDVNEELNGKVFINAVRFNGEPIISDELDVKVSPLESKRVGSLPMEELAEFSQKSMVRVYFEGPVRSYPNYHFLEPFKRLELPEVSLGMEVRDNEISLEPDGPALFVKLDADHLEGRFSDNYFHLSPGESRRLEFEPISKSVSKLKERIETTHLRETY